MAPEGGEGTVGDLFSPAGRDLILCLRRILRHRAAAHSRSLLRVIVRTEDPRRGARYLGRWLGRLPPDAVVSVLAALLERAEQREPGSELAVEAILCAELRESWDEGLSRKVQSLARSEGHFDLAAMLLELPVLDERFRPAGTKLPKDLQKVPLGVRKAMARRQDIHLMERLLADPDRSVIANLLDNPRLTLQEVIRLAAGPDVREDVLEAIAVHPRWIPRYRVKVTLACNPLTPTRVSVGLLRLLMAPELRALSRDGRVSAIVSRRAGEILRERAKRGAEPLIVLHIPGSSRRVPEELMGLLAISLRELREELRRWTDAFADELFSLDHPLAARVVFPWNHHIVDPSGITSPRLLRSSVLPEERLRLIGAYCRPGRRLLDSLVSRALEAHGRCLLVVCRSFPSSPVPVGADRRPGRPDVCVGTDLSRTPPPMAAFALGWFRENGYAVLENSPCRGTFTAGLGPESPAGLRTITVGLNRKCYMDEETGLRHEGFEKAREMARGFLAELAARFEAGEF